MNRFNKFYNPSQYQPPPKRQLSEDAQITFHMGGTLAPTDAPGSIAGTVQAAPPPSPEANLAYKKKGEEFNGVIQMIKTIFADVDKEIQVMQLEEKDAQQDYEKFMNDAKNKRAEDSQSLTDKEGALAETTEELVASEEGLKNTKLDLMATDKALSGFHGDCDWLLKHFDARAGAYLAS